MNEAHKSYRQARIKTLEKENIQLINTLVETQKINKMLWLALIIMSGLSFVQSLVILNG